MAIPEEEIRGSSISRGYTGVLGHKSILSNSAYGLRGEAEPGVMRESMDGENGSTKRSSSILTEAKAID